MLDLVEPRHLWVPPRVSSAGSEVVELAEMVGRPLDPEQCLAVDVLCSEGPGGQWAALEGAVIEARQNGKTGGILIPIALAHLFLFGDRIVTWTAHRHTPVMVDAFRDMKGLIEGCPELASRVAVFHESYGLEEIVTTDGAVMRFLARSGQSGQGMSGDLVVMDEAFAATPAQIASLMPTLSARPNPQLLHGSSAAHATSEVLHAVMERGRAGNDPDLAYVEWSAERGECRATRCSHQVGTAGCLLDDEARWLQANPAVARGRMQLRTLRSERKAMSTDPTKFAREIMGWEDTPAVAAKIPEMKWAALVDRSLQKRRGGLVLAVDASPGCASVSIHAARRRADGLIHLEHVDYRTGSDWAVGRLAQLVERRVDDLLLPLLVDPRSAAGALIPDLVAAGVEVREVSAAELGQACGGLQRAVTEARLAGEVDPVSGEVLAPSGPRHTGDELVTEALRGATSADLGDGAWKWTRRRSDVDICPLVSLTLAHWGLSTVEDMTDYDPLDNIF